MQNTLFIIGFNFLMFIISGFLLYYFFPYLTKKSQNKADLQDSAKLTQIIESVRSEFSTKIELLRTDLQMVSNYKIEHRNEERKAIIEFHSFLNEWMNRCFLIDVTVYNMKNCQELSLKRIELRNLNEKCVLAQSKVALLVKDSNLIQLSSKLVIEGIAFSGFAELFTFNLYCNLSCRDSNIARFIEIWQNKDMRDTALWLAAEDTKDKKEAEDLIQNWLKSKVSKYGVITPILYEFNESAKKYLTEIQ
jgi:hypothetical protein